MAVSGHLAAAPAWSLTGGQGASETGGEAEDPRIGYYVSETQSHGFVLDRSGEKGLLRFDQSQEVHVLDMVPGPQGVTYLKNRLGATMLRLMPWGGGATVYEADGSEGGAFGFAKHAKPLRLEARKRGQVERRLAEIGQTLASDYNLAITFELGSLPETTRPEIKPAQASRGIRAKTSVSKSVAGLVEAPARPLLARAGAQKNRQRSASYEVLGDALELASLALQRLAKDELAHEVMSDRIERVIIKAGMKQAIALDGSDLVVTCVPHEGVLGRPSSAEIETFLLENL